MLLVTGCSNSVENQTKTFQAQVTQVTRYQDRYPGFKSFLEQGKQNAEKAFKEAEGLDEKAGIEKIQQASQAFGNVFRELQRFDSLERKVRSRLQDLDRMDTDSSRANDERRDIWRDSDRILQDVNQAFANARPQTEGEAEELLIRQVRRLEDVENRINQTIARLRAKKDKKDQKRKEKEAKRQEKEDKKKSKEAKP